MKVRFTADAKKKSPGPGRPRQFRAGKVYELSEKDAEFWIGRNAAERVEDEHPAEHDDDGDDSA